VDRSSRSLLGASDEGAWRAPSTRPPAERFREDIDTPILPRYHALMKEARERLRKNLGPEDYDGSFSEGRGLSLETAVESALSSVQ
jgi:hypothetical protein